MNHEQLTEALGHPTKRLGSKLVDEVWRTSALIDRRRLQTTRWERLPLPDDVLIFPCPFCGSQELVALRMWLKNEAEILIHCDGCGCNGPTDTSTSPVEAWNKRTK